MKNKDGILKRFINSIYNLDEFPKYVTYGVVKAILYAFILSLFIGGIKGNVKVINVNNYMNEVCSTMDEDEYKFKISDNHLELENSPVIFENNKVLFYADENVTVDKIDDLRKMTVNEDINFLALKDGLFIKTNGDYDNIGDMGVYYSDMSIGEEITNSDIISLIKSSIPMLDIVIIGSYIFQDFFMYIISALFIAVLTIIPSKLSGVNYRLANLFSLVIYAYTLPNLLVLILNIIFPDILFDTAGMLGAMVYTYLAIRNIRKQINEKVV